MADLSAPKDPLLRNVFWRQEIIEVVLWLRGEGLNDDLDRDTLVRFLGLDDEEASRQLQRLTAEGYLHRQPSGTYQLTAQGEREARWIVRGQQPAPTPRRGVCGPTCWCHNSSAEAASCAASTTA